MNLTLRKRVQSLALVAGAMDFCTGLGLVFIPVWTLSRMQLTAPTADALVYLRWVGAFVAAVGASYLVALARGGMERLRETFGMTLLFRFAAGSYCTAAVISGGLEARWWVVSATDLGLFVVQLWMLWRGGWSDE